MQEAGQGGMYLQDHSQFAMVSTAATNNAATQITVDDALKTLSTDALAARMNSLKNFVKYFYGKCASEISRFSNDGAMTKYWWDIPECMPANTSPPAGGGTAVTPVPGTVNTVPQRPQDILRAGECRAVGTTRPWRATRCSYGEGGCRDVRRPGHNLRLNLKRKRLQRPLPRQVLHA